MYTGEGRREEDVKGKKEEGVEKRRRMKRLGRKEEEGRGRKWKKGEGRGRKRKEAEGRGIKRKEE